MDRTGPSRNRSDTVPSAAAACGADRWTIRSLNLKQLLVVDTKVWRKAWGSNYSAPAAELFDVD